MYNENHFYHFNLNVSDKETFCSVNTTTRKIALFHEAISEIIAFFQSSSGMQSQFISMENNAGSLTGSRRWKNKIWIKEYALNFFLNVMYCPKIWDSHKNESPDFECARMSKPVKLKCPLQSFGLRKSMVNWR